jgi:hypothetical protein
MKPYSLIISLLGVPALSAADPQNLIRNGDFQAGSGVQFYAVQDWYNHGKGRRQDLNARTDAGFGMPGEFAATINDRYDAAAGKFGPTAHVQKTEHVIRPGDAFALSYVWRPADENWQKRRDTVRFVLFATEDDTLAARVVWSVVLTSDFFLGDIRSMKFVTQETDPVPPAAVGKKLIVTFFGVDTEDGIGGSTHFARVDDIVVSVVTPDPEIKTPAQR